MDFFEAVRELTDHAQKDGKSVVSWRITPGRGQSGSGGLDPLGDAEKCYNNLLPSEYTLWLTSAPSQIYTGPEFIGTRRFNKSKFSTSALRDDQLGVLMEENLRLKKALSDEQARTLELVVILSDSTIKHSKSTVSLAEGAAKTLESTHKGLASLVEGTVEMLGTSKDIMVGSAVDATNLRMADKEPGLLRRLCDPIIGDLSQGLRELALEGVPVAIKLGKWALDSAGKALAIGGGNGS